MYIDFLPLQSLDIILSLLQIALIFVAIKDHPGKLIFVILSLSNFGNLAIVLSKFLEAQFFPREAMLRYHYTYTFFLIAVEAVIIPLIYFFVYRYINPSEDEDYITFLPEYKKTISKMWMSLWIIPALFYLIWMHHFYYSNTSTIKNILDPVNTGYIFIVDIGSVLIYRTILNLVSTQEKNLRLQAINQTLSMREYQYNVLNRQIEETRKTRHDLRNQVNILKIIRETKDMEILDDLIKKYENQYSFQPLRFCSNETVNPILFYYYNRGKDKNIEFDITCNIPEKIFIDRMELSVLFGALLENAIELTSQKESDRFVNIRSNYSSMCVSIIVSNSYDINGEKPEKIFKTTKNDDSIVGMETIKSIASHYNGTSSFTSQDEVFTASVLLYPIIPNDHSCIIHSSSK